LDINQQVYWHVVSFSADRTAGVVSNAFITTAIPTTPGSASTTSTITVYDKRIYRSDNMRFGIYSAYNMK